MKSSRSIARAGLLASIAAMVALSAGRASALPVKPTGTPGTETAPPVVVAPPPAPYIEAVRYAGGNGDQTPDPGERLRVFFSLRNPTDQTLVGVTGTLTIKNSDVTVIDPSAAWPDIPAGGIAEASAPFVIEISAGAARAQPCAGGPIMVPAPGSVEPVSSDVAVSSAGETGGGPGSVQGSPGSVPPSDPTTATPPAVAPSPPASRSPATPPSAAPVPFDASVAVHTDDASFQTDLVSGLACPLAVEGNGKTTARTRGALDPGGPEIPVTAGAARAATGSTDPAHVVAVLLAAAGALVARYRVKA